MNRPATSLWVASATTTEPGSASACSRAARLGVSPTTASSCAAPSPIRSPTTTSPVAMPTRAASGLPPGAVRPAGRGCGGETCANRALGVVLVRLRPAEIGEHAVAHQLGDSALVAGDLARHRLLVGENDLAHVLRVEPLRQLGRADEIDEHDGELPPLCAGIRGGRPAAQPCRSPRSLPRALRWR